MKISFSLRAFVVYFLILGSLLWFTLDNAIERLNDGMRQSAESVMVDIAHIMASVIEKDLHAPPSAVKPIPTDTLQTLFADIKQRTLDVKIYQVTKAKVDTDVYITDTHGTVLYDSSGITQSKNVSQWRDVYLTLKGQYGARTSFKDPDKTEQDDEQIMVVAAPIRQNNEIVGVVSVVKSINSLKDYLLTESNQLKRYGILLLLLASVIGYLMSMWFTASLKKISKYADTMATGRPAKAPEFMDKRFDQLASSLSHMRKQLDGKEYVENYIHSLTHELKTPITSIRSAVELLNKDIPAVDQEKFLDNINTSNHRMARLVDRMLSLAKLESLTELVEPSAFELLPTLRHLVQERETHRQKRGLTLNLPDDCIYILFGDKLLLSQAIANLLDNAIDFCTDDGVVSIEASINGSEQFIRIHNQGAPIPDFAQERIFERFFSLPRPGNNQQKASQPNKSTGLGLSFVKEIMKLHHGVVTVSNTSSGVQATLHWSRQFNS